MRTARIIGEGASYYHCMSRIVDKQMLLDSREKERFRKIIRKVAAFSGVEVLTYALMNNHIHLLLLVPERPADIPEDEVLNRIEILYDGERKKAVAEKLRQLHEEKLEKEAAALLYSYTYRMYDLSQFMKMTMQRFTMSYNRRHDRRGHLWEQRFKSILVEGKPDALATMAAYIDLNPVRAGIVKDPGKYRFCGYGEAVAGVKTAREGMQHIASIIGIQGSWSEIAPEYRKHIFMEAGSHKTAGVDRKKIREVLEKGGRLSKAELLHCRLRYLSDGVVLGTQNFVEDVFQKHREEFDLKRKTGARRPRYGDWGPLCTMRQLRLKPVSLS